MVEDEGQGIFKPRLEADDWLLMVVERAAPADMGCKLLLARSTEASERRSGPGNGGNAEADALCAHLDPGGTPREHHHTYCCLELHHLPEQLHVVEDPVDIRELEPKRGPDLPEVASQIGPRGCAPPAECLTDELHCCPADADVIVHHLHARKPRQGLCGL